MESTLTGAKRTRDESDGHENQQKNERKRHKRHGSMEHPVPFLEIIEDQQTLLTHNWETFSKSKDLFDSTEYFSKKTVLTCSQLRELTSFVCMYLLQPPDKVVQQQALAEEVFLHGRLVHESAEHPSMDVYELNYLHSTNGLVKDQVPKTFVYAGTAVMLPLLQHRFYEQFSAYFVENLEIKDYQKLMDEKPPVMIGERRENYLSSSNQLSHIDSRGCQHTVGGQPSPTTPTSKAPPRSWESYSSVTTNRKGFVSYDETEESFVLADWRNRQRSLDIKVLSASFTLGLLGHALVVIFLPDWENQLSLSKVVWRVVRHLAENYFYTESISKVLRKYAPIPFQGSQKLEALAEYIAVFLLAIFMLFKLFLLLMVRRFTIYIGRLTGLGGTLWTSLLYNIMMTTFFYRLFKYTVADVWSWTTEREIWWELLPLVALHFLLLLVVLLDQSAKWLLCGGTVNVRPLFFTLLVPGLAVILGLHGGSRAASKVFESATEAAEFEDVFGFS